MFRRLIPLISMVSMTIGPLILTTKQSQYPDIFWGIHSPFLASVVESDQSESNTDTPQNPGPGLKSIAVSDEDTYALTPDGQIKNWGLIDVQPIPAPILFETVGITAVKIVAGEAHTCLLTDQGAVKC